MNEISWPERYIPGTTDNYVSNETIVRGLSAADVWPYLDDTSTWPSYYDNAPDVSFPDGTGPELRQGTRFRFATFDFPPLEAEVMEYVPPADSGPVRLSWRAWQETDGETVLDVYHAWLVEDLDGDRVRILTQESQLGQAARELAQQHPNPMLNGHQDWVDGLARTAAEWK